MKWLLVLMILLSVAIGIPLNGGDKGWLALWGTELFAIADIIKNGGTEWVLLISWCMLLIAHLTVISLFFLTKSRHFNSLLWMAPLSFILLYVICDFLIAILLVPFAIVWIIAMIVQYNR